MKIRYKKAILLTILISLGIGIIALSLINSESNKDRVSKDVDTLHEQKNMITNDDDTPDITSFTTTLPPTSAPLPTSAPSPTPLPIYALEEDGYPKITALIVHYYEAKLNCDIADLESMLSKPTNVPSLEQLKKDIMYVEKYPFIKCYVKKGYEKGSYIVFVYNEIKFINIDTPAPAVDRFFIITDENGELKIFSGDFDELTKAYYYERINDADVSKLIEETNAKGEVVKEKDELLKTFWEELQKTHEEMSED